jgi:hypothetical protein
MSMKNPIKPHILRVVVNAVVKGATAYAENGGPLNDAQIVNEALSAIDLGFTDEMFAQAMAVCNEARAAA